MKTSCLYGNSKFDLQVLAKMVGCSLITIATCIWTTAALDIKTSMFVGEKKDFINDLLRSDCWSLGGSLGSIHSQEESDFVFNLIQPHSGGDPFYGIMFLGASRGNDGGNYEWDDGTPWDYQNWNSGITLIILMLFVSKSKINNHPSFHSSYAYIHHLITGGLKLRCLNFFQP